METQVRVVMARSEACEYRTIDLIDELQRACPVVGVQVGSVETFL